MDKTVYQKQFDSESACKIIYLFLKDSAGYAEAEALCSIKFTVWDAVIDSLEEHDEDVCYHKSRFNWLFDLAAQCAANMVGFSASKMELYYNGMCSEVTLDEDVPPLKASRFALLMGDFGVTYQGETL